MRSVDLTKSPGLNGRPSKMLERYLHTTERMNDTSPPFLVRGSSRIVLPGYQYRSLVYDLVDGLFDKLFPCYQYK